jgi:serine protease Do
MLRFVLVLGIGVVFSVALFCGSSESPAAPEKDHRIWTEAPGATAPAIPPGYNPVQGFSGLVKGLHPMVVNISTTTEVPQQRFFNRRRGMPGDPMDDFFRRFFGDQFESRPQQRNSLGSGFIVNPDGYVMTNNHVVAGASEIRVKFVQPDRELTAKVIGRDEKYDLALLKVDTNDRLPSVTFGDSDALEIGEWVIAIGSPFGLAHTVTAGIVSAKDRVIGAGPFDDFIQTDASINPGNSGGPLFDARGHVVGINTAIHAAGQGIGFAVPVNMAKQFIRDVLTKGRVTRGWLGVGIQELTPELAAGLKLKDTKGLVVSQVFPGSPAQKAGLRRGDVILSFAGRTVDSAGTLTRTVGLAEPGSSHEIKVIRDGKAMSFKVTLDEREEDRTASAADPEGSAGSDLGIEVEGLSARDAQRLRLDPGQGGVLVRSITPGGPASDTGIRPGDVLLEVDRMPIGSPADFSAAISKVKSGGSVLLLLLRENNYFYAVVKKP